MQDSFYENSQFEDEGEKIFFPAFSEFLTERGQGIKIHSTFDEQKNGDYSIFDNERVLYTIDRKHERSTSPNLFFEIYSNYKPGKFFNKLGWGLTENCDYIVYSFLGHNLYPFFSLKKLRQYLDIKQNDEIFLRSHIENNRYKVNGKSYRIVEQRTHFQKNITVGILVPFLDISDCVFSIGCIENKIFKKCDYVSFLKIAKRMNPSLTKLDSISNINELYKKRMTIKKKDFVNV